MSFAMQRDSSTSPTPMVLHTRNNNETVTKTLFLALDPILQKLLVVQRQLRSLALQESACLLPLLQKHHELLFHFENMIRSVRNNEAFATRDELACSVAVLLKYVSLPLIVACKVPASLDWNLTSWFKESSLLNRSAMFKCVDQVARLWRFLVTCVESYRDSPSQYPGPGGAAKAIWLQAMISLVSALPSGQQVTDNQHSSITLLDRGEVCLQSLLEAIIDLTTVCSPKEIFLVWDGGLVFRIADTCISLLTPPPMQIFEGMASRSNARKARSTPLSLRLAATATLCQLLVLESTPNSRRLWQQAFPGCFAGLYRSTLPLLRAVQREVDENLTVKLLQCLTALVNCCLLMSAVTSDNDVEQKKSEAACMLQQLAQAANRAWQDDHQHRKRSCQSPAGSDALPESEVQFFEQVKLCLPAPLLVLIPILTALKSVNVRRETAFLLCTLYKARNRLENGPLTVAIYESCLLMTSRGEDMDPKSLAACHEVLNSSENNFELLENKIVDMIRELVPLARRQSKAQLQAKQRLLAAVLSQLNTTSVKRLRVTLSTSEVAAEVQASLILLLEIDFSLPSVQSLAVVVQVVDRECGTDTTHEPSQPRPRHLDSEALTFVNEFIRELGRLLGPRTASVVVDSMVARLYQSYGSRVERSLSLDGPSQVQWLQEWLGSFLVIKPMLQGAFQCCKQRRRMILEDLFESILHIMISSALFDPPTQQLSRTDVPRVSVSGETSVVLSDLSTLALRGNECAIHLQLDIIGTVAELLQGDFRRFLPLCLFPLLAKSIPGSSVRDKSMSTLGRIAMSCGYASHLSLIDDNLGSVVGAMSASLRIPGGRTLSGIVDLDKDVIGVAATAALILRMIDSIQGSEATLLSHRNAVSGLLGVVKDLMSRFDHSNTRLRGEAEMLIVFVRLFHSTLQHLQQELCRFERVELEESQPPNEQWRQLLECFKSLRESPKERSIRHRELRAAATKGDNLPETIDRETLAVNTQFVARILSRCCYALSSSSLLVQITTVDALISGFSYLGWIAANVPPKAEESNGPTTAILRQVHSTWTSIAARLEAIAGSVTNSHEGVSSLLVSKPIPSSRRQLENMGEQRLFLSKLLALIANMTECAGDFMAERLRESVWPCLSRVISMFLRRKNAATGSHVTNASRVPKEQPYAESERRLLVSVIIFLKRVYAHRAVGLAMVSLIPTTGAMILPFLGDHDKDVSEACDAALKCMMWIDCDALWRPLLELSGRQLPGCPLLASKFNRNDHATQNAVATANPQPNSRLAHASATLLDFIDALPEQPLH
jgi:hypothetical protein